MKVVVTGGAGFIGSHIVDQCIRKGYEVIVIDNLATGKRQNLNLEATFYEADIASPAVRTIFEKEKPDYLIHHAAQASVPGSLKNPVADATTNIVGTVNLLEACRLMGVKKVIYASSAAAYGEPEYTPLDERHKKQPLSPYGISKYVPEYYLHVYHHLYGLPYTAFRYANVYGERQDPYGEGGVISIFVDRVLAGQELRVYGSGEQTRDFVYVEDVARANLMALAAGDNQIFNISTNKRTSVNQLIEELNILAAKPVTVKHEAPREGDIMHSYLNNAGAKEGLGWEPHYSLADGLAKTMKYYQKLSQNQ
ncbi:NAD-dependent epimerase/dehydratase family protein [Aneurinibacillus sp. Ricciae_BoGa-3]|uniref:NAD-dependent epimerase/dehydratase family protein n=1 Tax=Aneurinibacillus sp. Ricciae_BoGa-3 TaxID=3022697 RepID=UPI0023414771|nr:NAD-dependent epimerase/dehydratase family protein [Aneurinibacillus sp. Ricciae_BoGa-3]WCK53718.1 NAD-dependent epimerase/dehydratase family protein [Aneurinibacillus sp. Ricciae_BoGa-3]